MPQPHATPSQEALSLGAASRVLGVDPDTLRRWADQGRVRFFLTPGGHRRFDRASLERVRRAGGRDQASPAGLGLTQSRLLARYRRTYRRPAAGRPDPRALVGPIDVDAFRDEGRRLIDALIAYLDAGSEDARVMAWEEARRLARRHADRLAEGGASLTDGVALFVAARQPFLAEVGALTRRRSLDPQQLTRSFEDAAALLDRLLLEFVDGYRSGSQGGS
jgi:excisionase family DNA binding protein